MKETLTRNQVRIISILLERVVKKQDIALAINKDKP
jgi:hypothetical protein